MRTTFIAIAIAAFTAGAAYGQLFQNAAFNGPATTDPNCTYDWIDINGDGRTDILELYGYTGNLLQIANAGGFTITNLGSESFNLEKGYFAYNDHNSDGDIDILTLRQGKLSILDYDPATGFTFIDTGITFPDGYYARLQWADLNGDLALDIIMGRTVYLKQNGTYQESPNLLPDLLSSMFLEDMNGDGLTDIVAGGYEGYNGTTLSVLINKGAGNFDGDYVDIPGTNLVSSSITLIDVDRDTDLDIFAVDNYARGWIFRNKLVETGTMEFVGTQILSTYVSRAVVGDINSDGLQDLVVASDNKLTILKNTSNATTISFTAESHDQPYDIVLDLALVDIDLDNDLDIHFKTQSATEGNQSLLFKNTSASPGAVPGTPANLASAITTNVSLSWTNVPGMLYNFELKRNGVLYRSSSTSLSGKLLLPAGNQLRKNGSLILRGLPGGSYQWRLQAISPSGRSSAFTAASTFTVADPPSALTVQASDLRKVRLCWAYSGPGTASFAIFRRTSSTVFAELGRVAAGVLCFDDNNVPANETVDYYVMAVNGASYSAPSNTVTHHSTQFVETEFGVSNPNIISSRCFPADYDLDGDYDLEFIGRIGSSDNNVLLKNSGAGVFTSAGSLLTYDALRVPYTEMAPPKDLDNDGDADFVVIAGQEYGLQQITVFKNNNGTFTTGYQTPAYLGILQLAVEDLNSDGLPDLLFSHTIGNSPGNPIRFELLYQTADGNFKDSNIRFSDEQTTAYAFFRCIDLNNDGFLDIMWTPSDGYYTDILVNVRGTGFVRKTTKLPATSYMGVEDYTGDGYVDVALQGNEGLNIYYGTKDLTFKDPKVVPLSSSSVGGSTFINADIDQNGWQDLIMSGDNGSMIVLNNGNGLFKESNIVIKRTSGSSIAITDFENDGDIDLVKPGNDGQHQGFNYFYKNQLADIGVVNLPPAVPSNFSARYDSGSVTLKWTAPTDDKTPSPLLSYNLNIVDANGKVWLNAETNATGNFMRTKGAGNAGHATQKTLNHLPFGVYTARIQALDGSFALSPWSGNIQFTITQGPTALLVERILLNKISLKWTNGPQAETNVIVERRVVGSGWTIAATLPAGATSYVDGSLEYNLLYEYRVFESVGSLSTATSNIAEWSTNMWVLQDTDLPNIYGSVDVADFTNDGRMDMVINGGMIYNGTYEDITKATFENTAGGWVKRDITPSVLIQTAAISFQDFNGDFQPDIYQDGYVYATGYHAEVFGNNGDKTFSPVVNDFSNGTNAIRSFFDFDMDNDLDVLAIKPDAYPTIHDVYRNNGSGNYVSAGETACIACGEIVAVADFDRDGDEDVIRRINYNYQLFLNSPDGLVATEVVFSVYESTGMSIVDYNSDGFPDIALLTNSSYQGGRVLKNLGVTDGSAPKFSELPVNLSSGDQNLLSGDFDHDGRTDLAVLSPAINIMLNRGNDAFDSYVVPRNRVSSQTARLIDFDNDGDLDIILGGYIFREHTDYIHKEQILLNQTIVSTNGIFNEAPKVPVNLNSTQDELGLHLSWSAPTDDHTPSAGLTYDVVLYRDGKIITKGNLNPTTGRRLRLAPGKFTQTAAMSGLQVGTYTWRVQAVDGSFAGSTLSDEGTFVFRPSPPAVRDTTIYLCGRTVTLGAAGSNLKWYSDKNVTQLLATGAFQPTQTQTVYVTQTVNGYEGVAKKVKITMMDKPAMPAASTINPFRICETPASQIIAVTGVDLNWYSDQALTQKLSNQQQLQIAATNATYYVTQTIDGCQSNPLAMKVEVETIDSQLSSDGKYIMVGEQNANYYIWYRNGINVANTTVPRIPYDGVVATFKVYVVKGSCYEYSDVFVSTPENITAIEEPLDSLVSIYPNPASSDVTLKTDKSIASVTIMDSMGRHVYSYQQNGAMLQTINVKEWSKGVYTILIDDGKNVATKRLVVF